MDNNCTLATLIVLKFLPIKVGEAIKEWGKD